MWSCKLLFIASMMSFLQIDSICFGLLELSFIRLCWLLNLDSFSCVRRGKCLRGFRPRAVLERKKEKKKKE